MTKDTHSPVDTSPKTKCGSPTCPLPGRYKCRKCGRRLCAWHYVLQPIKSGGDLQPVCFPDCENAHWRGGEPDE